jgi:hypothetical protein
MKTGLEKYRKYIPEGWKAYEHGMVLMWKLGLGKLINLWPEATGRSLVLGLKGSAGTRLIPMLYCRRDEFIFCTSLMKENQDAAMDAVANPQVEVWLPDGWYAGSAEIVEDAEERAGMLRQVLSAGGFMAPWLLGIHPQSAEEERFRQATAGYRLLRIRRQSARTGSDGPGSLAWLWPLALLAVCLRGKRRK